MPLSLPSSALFTYAESAAEKVLFNFRYFELPLLLLYDISSAQQLSKVAEFVVMYQLDFLVVSDRSSLEMVAVTVHL